MLNKIYKIFLLEKIILAFKKDYVGYGDANKSDKCLKQGYLPLLVDYFSPFPDLEDLNKRKVWDKKTRLMGIDFNIKDQLKLIKKIGERYDKNLNLHSDIPLYCLIREFKPKKIIEIGLENHSSVINLALEENKKIGEKTKYYKVYPKRVELLKKDFFDGLIENDFLIINSNHYIKIGSDVNYIFLDILPRLKPGVIIGISNITLPYEYPKKYATREFERHFWTEQYLLQAFLMFNREFEIILATNYLINDHYKEFYAAFPSYDSKENNFTNRGFLIRRKIK